MHFVAAGAIGRHWRDWSLLAHLGTSGDSRSLKITEAARAQTQEQRDKTRARGPDYERHDGADGPEAHSTNDERHDGAGQADSLSYNGGQAASGTPSFPFSFSLSPFALC
jgi:hypothetical protein